MEIPFTPAQLAGLALQVAAYNAGQAEGETLTPEQYAAAMFESQQDEWAQLALRLPTFKFIKRWTKPEYDAVMAAAEAGDAGMSGYVDMLENEPITRLDDPRVVAGVPAVCAWLESVGVIAEGQAVTRAAAILAY